MSFKFNAPAFTVTKSYQDENGQRFIEGIASTTNLDLTDERMSPEVIAKGSGTLTAGTTTTVTNALAKTTSVIIIQPTSAALTLLGVWVSTKSAGSFVLTHGIAVGTETFDYLIV